MAQGKLTVKEVKELLSVGGIVVKKVEGEYRVNYRGGEEATAYYTDDIMDAFHTGMKMSEARVK